MQKHTNKISYDKEQLFRFLTEQSSDIILLVDRNGIITYENKAVEEVLGYKPQERIGGSSFDTDFRGTI